MDTGVNTKEMQVFETVNVAVFDITEAAISELSRRYMALTIKDIDDRVGFEAVHIARMDMKARRVSVEKDGKKYRDKINFYIKDELAKEKHVLSLMAPIEDYLTDEENRVLEARAAIKAEAEAKQAALTKARVDRLYALGCRFTGTRWTFRETDVASQDDIASIPDAQFLSVCDTLQNVLDAEAQAAAEAEAARKAEVDRLAQVAAAQEAERKRLAEVEAKIKAEQEAVAREKQRLIDEEAARVKAAEDAKLKAEEDARRQKELEAAKAEAAEKARLAEIERVRLEAEEKAKKEEKARIAAAKKEARRPDKEKLLDYTRAISDIPKPQLKHEETIGLLDALVAEIGQVLADFNKRMEEL